MKKRFCPFTKLNSKNNFYLYFRTNRKQSHANVFDIYCNFSFILTLLYGLHCTFHLCHFYFIFVVLAHLHVFDNWHYGISSNDERERASYSKINIDERAKSRRNSEEIQRGKVLLH